MELSDEEATSKLDQLARDGELSVEMERPQIYFSNGTVQALARVNTGIDIWVALQATIGAKDGKPDVKIESLNLGRLPIPKTLVNSVVTALQRATEERWENLHVLLHEVIIGNGEITVTLIKK
jgi:hypothetical protein